VTPSRVILMLMYGISTTSVFAAGSAVKAGKGP